MAIPPDFIPELFLIFKVRVCFNKMTPLLKSPKMPEVTSLQYFLYQKENAPFAEEFNKNYDAIKIITAFDEPGELKEVDKRACRFCGYTSPKVNFKNKAHIIPHQLGNENLISDFECDSCNKVFSNYESELAKFLGITRTVMMTKGKKGIPNFFSPKNSVTAEIEKFFNIKKAVKVSAGDSLDFDVKSGMTVVEYEKNPYRPLLVFKSLMRIGFCMMETDDLKSYSATISKLLLSNKYDLNCSGNQLFDVYCSNLPHENPTHAILFKKKTNANIPSHVMILFSGQAMYQLTMPFHIEDEANYWHDFSALIMPPFHYKDDYKEEAKVETRMFNWSSCDLKEEKGVFGFNADPSHFNNIGAFDPKTNKFIDVDITKQKIVGFYLVKNGSGPIEFPKSEE